MYYPISLIIGSIIAVMITINGWLTARYGMYTAAVIIHIVGLIVIMIVLFIKKDKPFAKMHPWYFYLGGAIGVATTVFNNLAFGRISVSAIMALLLFGQSIFGLIIDQYGLMGMPKHPFTKGKLAGLILMLGGIAVMMNQFEIVAVIVSFIAGLNIIVSRTIGAKLGELTNVRISTFYNYLIGLVVAIPVLLFFGRNEQLFTGFTFYPSIYLYLGGAFGVIVILVSNILVVKISAFYLTLLIFMGQVFAGVLIDVFISGAFDPRNLIGGILVAFGLGVNLLIDRKN